MPGTSFQDDARAMSLLEPYSRVGSTYDTLRKFGAILHAQLAESVKARGRAEQLREQLDALRAIERTIIERGRAAAPAKQ
jgi:23S rRNA maturation mini-RNase III